MHENNQEKKSYVLYGTGGEAECFLFRNLDIFSEIEYCIDSYHTGTFHGFPIYKPDQIDTLDGRKIIVAALVWETYLEMKESLEKRGFKEFEHFIWSKFFKKKIVLINANCHGSAIMKYLEQSNKFCDEYAIYPLLPVHINEKKEIPVELLNNIDVYLHQDIRKDNQIGYKLSDEYVLPRLKLECKRIAIPNLVGMAEWMFPSLGGLDKVSNIANGAGTVLYRDRVLDKAAEKNLTKLEDFKTFWLNYKYTNEELDEKWEKGINKLQKREKNWDIKIVEYILKNYKTIPCFVDVDHPSKYVMREIGRQIAVLLELKDIDDSGYESGLGIPVPVMSIVKEHFGLDFKVPCEKKNYLGMRVIKELDDYIKAYVWWYHDVIIGIDSLMEE